MKKKESFSVFPDPEECFRVLLRNMPAKPDVFIDLYFVEFSETI